VDVEALKEEFEEYQHLEQEIGDGSLKALDEVWTRISQLEILVGRRSNMFAKAIGAVLCLPHSTAD